jgi:hypothetical protein
MDGFPVLKLMVSAAVEGSVALTTLKEGLFAADCTSRIGVDSWSFSHMNFKSNNLRISRKQATYFNRTKRKEELIVLYILII